MKERHLQIINLVNEKEKVSVQELSELLKLSMVTIRKDLEELESQGLLRRQHGYATKASPDAINSRMAFHYSEKKAIAKRAMEIVEPMETIMIESGSTCALFALGGDYDTVAEVTTGPVTQLCAREYHVDKLFVGVDGYTEENGFTNINHTRSAVVKEFAKQADHVIVLTTSDKFGKRSVAKLFDSEEVSMVVTDDQITPECKETMERHGIQVITTTTQA